MISADIPGYGFIQLENLVLDFNGTIAQGGRLSDGVGDALEQLRCLGMTIYIVTADTNGTVSAECAGLPAEIVIGQGGNVAEVKQELVRTLGGRTVSIGNGRNDIKMFEESALSIAVIGEEGSCTRAALAADILTTSVLDALNLLIHKKRLIAALRG